MMSTGEVNRRSPQTATEACRACGLGLPGALLDYGPVPVADVLSSRPNDTSTQAPLSLHRCDACNLVQLGSHIPPGEIYHGDYPYFSSAILSLTARMQKLADSLIERYQLDGHSSVVEIASNDGYLLQNFKRAGMTALGIEPAPRQARAANDKGIHTLPEFFSARLAQQINAGQGRFDLVLANNVIAHVPDIHDVMSGIAQLLKPGGAAVFEFHYAGSMIEHCQFDTIYHQHIFYFTLDSFNRIIRHHGLHANLVETSTAYGGALRVHIGKRPQAHNSVDRLLQREQAGGLLDAASYRQFAAAANVRRAELRALLDDLRGAGSVNIVGFGAAAKASTLLAVCGLDDDTLWYVVDNNTAKQGRYMPSTPLQIHAPEELRQRTPDYILLLAWNYADEIIQQLDWFRQQGGKFILPIPQAHVV